MVPGGDSRQGCHPGGTLVRTAEAARVARGVVPGDTWLLPSQVGSRPWKQACLCPPPSLLTILPDGVKSSSFQPAPMTQQAPRRGRKERGKGSGEPPHQESTGFLEPKKNSPVGLSAEGVLAVKTQDRPLPAGDWTTCRPTLAHQLPTPRGLREAPRLWKLRCSNS